jgi:hypothetical protein
MKIHLKYRRVLTGGFVLFLAGALSAQRTPDKKLLVKFETNQIVLIIPNSNFDANSPQATAALSKDFASAGIATLPEMKEWKGVLGTMVTFGLAVDGSWAQIYHERVQTSMQQATVAASTNSDHNALQLLNTQFANLAKWESVFLAERQNHNGARSVAPNWRKMTPC